MASLDLLGTPAAAAPSALPRISIKMKDPTTEAKKEKKAKKDKKDKRDKKDDKKVSPVAMSRRSK